MLSNLTRPLVCWAVLLCVVLVQTTAQAAEAPVAPTAAPGGAMLTVDQVAANWQKLNPSQQFIALDQILHAGQFESAEVLLARSHYASETDKQLARFYTGLIRKQQGRTEEAVAIFRELLAAHPDFDRVRLELADTLFATQQDESARHNFELILGSAGSKPDLARTTRAYIDAIDSRRLWDLSSYVSIAPSSNLNQGTDSRVVLVNGMPFTLSDRNVKKSGVGLTFGAQGSGRLPLSDRIDLVGTAGVNARRYSDGEFNDTLVNVSAGPRFRFDWGNFGVYATGERHWFGGEDYHVAGGGLISSLVTLSPQDLVSTDLSCSERQFSSEWRGSDLSGQGGTTCALNTRIEHHFDGATFANVLGGLKHEGSKLTNLDNKGWSAGAGIYRELSMGVSVYLQSIYTKADYEGLFPTMDHARRDQKLETSVNLTKRDFVVFGLAPTLALTYTVNDSNVAFMRYETYGSNLTFTKRF